MNISNSLQSWNQASKEWNHDNQNFHLWFCGRQLMQGKMSERNKVYSYQITHKYILLPLVGGEPLVCGIIVKSTSLFLESLANIEKAVWLNGFINKISNDKFWQDFVTRGNVINYRKVHVVIDKRAVVTAHERFSSESCLMTSRLRLNLR